MLKIVKLQSEDTVYWLNIKYKKMFWVFVGFLYGEPFINSNESRVRAYQAGVLGKNL
jgi:hypothetical protein